jgi:hypothetical protein
LCHGPLIRIQIHLPLTGPPLWSSCHSSCLQIHRPGFDSLRYHIFWEVVGLERGPLSLVSTNEELLGRKSSGSCLESREYERRDPSRWPRGTLYPQKLVLTLPTSCGHSVGIVRSRTQATEFSFPTSYQKIFIRLIYWAPHVLFRKTDVMVRWLSCNVNVPAPLVTGYLEDGARLAQGDPSTGRRRISFRGVHTMDTFCWAALLWHLVLALVAAAG